MVMVFLLNHSHFVNKKAWVCLVLPVKQDLVNWFMLFLGESAKM